MCSARATTALSPPRPSPSCRSALLDDGRLVNVFLSYNSHKSQHLRHCTSGDARPHATFSLKFSSFPSTATMRRYFSATEYKLFLALSSLTSPLSRFSLLIFRPSSTEELQGHSPMGRFLSILLPTSRAAPRNLFPLGGKRAAGEEKKGKEALLIEGFSINVSRWKGIIFSARKRPPHLFFQLSSSNHRSSSLPPCLFLSPLARRFIREICSYVQTCFSGGFLAAASSRRWQPIVVAVIPLGIDNAQDTPISTRRLSSTTNPSMAEGKYPETERGETDRPAVPRRKTLCGGGGERTNERTDDCERPRQSFIPSQGGGGTKGSLEGRPEKWRQMDRRRW